MTIPETKFVHIPLQEVVATVETIFRQRGCSEAEANRIATRLTDANLRGHDSHGVIRVPRYIFLMQKEYFKPNQTIEIVSENDVMAIVDGGFGFGQTIGEQAVDLGIEKAGKCGVSVIALRNSGHLGRIGDWADRAIQANLISIHVANIKGSQLVTPFGGRERRFSTSPYCVGIPVPHDFPIILDFATSSVAEGKALTAYKTGIDLPVGTFVDEAGDPSGSPESLYGSPKIDELPNANSGAGALRSFGEHKGSGLNFMIEILAGALTGSGLPTAPIDPDNRRVWNGLLSIYLSVANFRSEDSFAEEVRAFINFVKSSHPASGHESVLIPGEKENKLMSERSNKGIPISEVVWQEICDLLN